jgi:large subunit ribosomal protein L24
MKLKVNDQVKIVLGKDRGKTGKVERVLPKIQSVLVEGINQYKRHVKSQGQNQPGGVVDITKPLNIAKVQLICPKCHQPTRVGYETKGDKKLRICRKCHKPIDVGSTKAKKPASTAKRGE